MKSTVCKKANEQIRRGMKRADAFKWAWGWVKANAGKVEASTLQSGDTVEIAYGDEENTMRAEIVEVRAWMFGKLLFVFNYPDGREGEFVAAPSELFRKAA
mgnify:CR=1 FL=1